MTDEWMIEVIARRLDDEVPWTHGATIFKHQDWLDVVTHLWTDKKLRGALIEAYTGDIANARAEQILEDQRASAYAEWRADSSLRGEVEDL